MSNFIQIFIIFFQPKPQSVFAKYYRNEKLVDSCYKEQTKNPKVCLFFFILKIFLFSKLNITYRFQYLTMTCALRTELKEG